MFNLAISWLTTSNFPWFLDLRFQVLTQFSLQHWTLLSPPDTYTTELCFRFGPIISFFPKLLVTALRSSPVAYQTPSDQRGSSSRIIFFVFSYCPWGSLGKNTGVGCHFLLQWTMFCQNSSLWPVCLGWPCTAWLIASPSYASPSAMTRQWSMKRKSRITIWSSNPTPGRISWQNY